MPRPPHGNSAFTLVELMISVLMVVLLMIGINQVFKLSSDTVGLGQTAIQISNVVRAITLVLPKVIVE